MRTKYKIVFLGNANVGKTTLISQFVYKQADKKYNPTIGIDFLCTTIEVAGKKVKLQLWDTAGQERFNSIIPNYTRDSFISIIVFDLTDEQSFNSIDHWIEDLVWINDPDKKCKLIIVGNKKDMIEKCDEMIAKCEEKAAKISAKFVVTSAMEYEDLGDMVKGIYEYIEDDIKLCETVIDLNCDGAPSKVNLNAKKNYCC